MVVSSRLAFMIHQRISHGWPKAVFKVKSVRLRRIAICFIVLAQFSSTRSHAQQPGRLPEKPLTLDQAVEERIVARDICGSSMACTAP